MRRALQLWVLLLIPAVSALGLSGADSGYSLAVHSTLRVEEWRGRTLGAAVCLGDGLAVTAAHVIREHKPFRLVGGAGKSDWQRVPLAVHPYYELALVQAPAGCAPALLASPSVTDEVFTLGFPENGWERHASFGRVGSISGRYVRTNILVTHGHSGGGLWTLDGKLVGICSGKTVLGSQFIDIAPVVQMAQEIASRVGYPFHPPGKPKQLRTAHLAGLRTPALIVQGERDAFGSRAEVETYRLSPAIRLEWIPDADHSLKSPKKYGRTETQNLAQAVSALTDFVLALP